MGVRGTGTTMTGRSPRLAYGSVAYTTAMDAAWREIRSHLSNGIPLAWTIQRARVLYRQAHVDECRRARGQEVSPC